MAKQNTRNMVPNSLSRKTRIKFSFWVIVISIVVMALCVSIANAGTCSSPPSGTASVVTETATAKCILSIIIKQILKISANYPADLYLVSNFNLIAINKKIATECR